MRWVEKVLDTVQLTTIVAGSILLVVMTVLMFVTTVLRYFMGSALDYTNIIIIGSMVWITFLLIGSVARKNEHIRITLVPDIVFRKYSNVFTETVENIVATPLCIWMTCVGIDRIQFLMDQDTRYMIGATDSYAAWIPNLVLPIGFGLASLFYVERTLRQLLALVRKIGLEGEE